MYNIIEHNGNLYITELHGFDIPKTLDCGQAFRWSCLDGGRWHGIAYGKYLEIEALEDGTVVLYGTDTADFNNLWRQYFDFDRDYDTIISDISGNEVLKRASVYGAGIHILNQEPWETLCSFIISQNNNIPRIKGIIERLCENFGDSCGGGYTFPSAERIAALNEDDLSVLRCGFRSRYIIDAARKVADGTVDLNALKSLDVDSAKNELMKITGVGPKVADCTLLFSLKFIEAFPKDVWIKRAMQVLFGGELPQEALPYAGIVQQYIFYYARETKLAFDEQKERT